MTPEQKKEVIDAINNDQYDEARDIIAEVEKIHIGDCLDGFWDGYDAITYEKDYPGRGHWRQSCAIFHGIPVTLGEFYIDNLRFSVSNNFA